ncbi:MAG: glutathione S-transferase [Nisaea sp.]|jgi:glutathione S-transferase|nr:glutathione S-transferase [Rhodospirillaceae bacterium]MCH2629714.1 glutathione S-transferase [Nisaea sp.]MEC7972008.1 glutathione S-transferase [Pseudomonadota bacterium]
MREPLEPNKRLPVLYSFRRCPYAMRARMAINQADKVVELREVVLRDKPAHMVELSPKATVPVLWLEDGTVIDESLEVMAWAADYTNWPSLLLETNNGDLISKNDTSFKFHLDKYKYPNRYEDTDALEHREAALAILKNIEANLQDDWLGGSEPNFSDIAILPFVRQFRGVDTDWFDSLSDISKTISWTKRFLDWEGFTSIMKKYPQWKPGDCVTTFGVTSL